MTPDAILERWCYGPTGTFGTLSWKENRIYTVERPWLNNRPRTSCIPEGMYTCRPRRYNRGGYDAIEVARVPGRTHILIHKANTPHEVEGCIGVGEDLGVQNGIWAVLNSAAAFRRLMDSIGTREFTLKICRPEPGWAPRWPVQPEGTA